MFGCWLKEEKNVFFGKTNHALTLFFLSFFFWWENYSFKGSIRRGYTGELTAHWFILEFEQGTSGWTFCFFDSYAENDVKAVYV